MADCAHAGLTQIPKSLPKDTDWLILSGNNISSLHMEDLKLLSILSSLDLKYNTIESISEDFVEYYSKHSNLINFDISHNELRTLPKNATFFKKLSLSGNRFQCKCDNMWMRNWLINQSEAALDFSKVRLNNSGIIEDATDINCTLSSGEEIRMIDMNPRDMGCPQSTMKPVNLWKILGFIIIYCFFY